MFFVIPEWVMWLAAAVLWAILFVIIFKPRRRRAGKR